MSKTLIWTGVAVLVALIVYDKVLKPRLGMSGFEDELEDDDEI